jgi:hypothetical protein
VNLRIVMSVRSSVRIYYVVVARVNICVTVAATRHTALTCVLDWVNELRTR